MREVEALRVAGAPAGLETRETADWEVCATGGRDKHTGGGRWYLRRPRLGVEENILRANIAKLTTSSTSLMPNELEKTMTRQELADLMAFLQGR